MNRWTFIGGLTVTLMLLLILSGFCVWATRGLTDDFSSIINRNYDNIRSLRQMSSALARINTRALVAKDPGSIPAAIEPFRQERDVVEKRLTQVQRNATTGQEREMVARLTALGQAYFAAYDEWFKLRPAAEARMIELRSIITGLTGDTIIATDQIIDYNENAILARRDSLVLKGRRITIIAVGFAIFSLGIYILTSMRLTRAVFDPLRRLRDSIQLVSDRRFETVIPVESGDELGQIAISFNNMARELQRYISETDERAVTASRMNRAILEALPYPVYIVNRDFVVSQTNPRAEELSRLLGIPGALPGEVRYRIDEAAAQNKDMLGDDIRRAVHLTPPNADYLPQIFRMPAALGVEDAWAVLLVDVTRLRRNDEVKRKALATLGHEVKTPVTGIRLSLHLLLEGKLGAINADQRELLEVGRDDCERLLGILQALLELARLESGPAELRLTPHAPADLLDEVASAQKDSMRRAGSELVLDVPAELPAVNVDPPHAHRLLGNFLSNARKYGKPGMPVVLRAQARGDGFVRISVVNHGRPLSDSEQGQVFDPFFRRSGESAEGTGLGLAICREIAVLHGGRIGVYCPAGTDLVEFYFDLRQVG